MIEHLIGDFPENWSNEDIGTKDLAAYLYPNEKIFQNLKLILIISATFLDGVCLITTNI